MIIVHINPIERAKLPTSAPEIFDRMNEISFNSSLMREMRAVEFVTRLIDESISTARNTAACACIPSATTRRWPQLGAATKLNPDWDFLCNLRDNGRSTAAQWLERNLEHVGRSSTVDLAQVFL